LCRDSEKLKLLYNFLKKSKQQLYGAGAKNSRLRLPIWAANFLKVIDLNMWKLKAAGEYIPKISSLFCCLGQKLIH
jgi:hypothetical protein